MFKYKYMQEQHATIKNEKSQKLAEALNLALMPLKDSGVPWTFSPAYRGSHASPEHLRWTLARIHSKCTEGKWEVLWRNQLEKGKTEEGAFRLPRPKRNALLGILFWLLSHTSASTCECVLWGVGSQLPTPSFPFLQNATVPSIPFTSLLDLGLIHHGWTGPFPNKLHFKKNSNCLKALTMIKYHKKRKKKGVRLPKL